MEAGTATLTIDQVRLMTADEARFCVNEVKRGMADVRHLLLDFYERAGWVVLGYANWRECAMSEFGYRQSHVYELLEAARSERAIRAVSATSETQIPVRQLRPLAGLQPEIKQAVWQRAVATAPDSGVTAAHVERTVAVVHGEAAHRAGRAKIALEKDGELPDTVTLRVARVIYLLTMGRHMTLAEIASITGLTENGAWRLMNRLSGGHHVPVGTDEESKWCVLAADARDWPY